MYERDWVFGDVSLGSAAGWAADEIRLIAELGYALAQNGRNHEAITVFEGLNTLAPSTSYFEAALGSLWLRENHPARALVHIDAAISENPNDLVSYVNRGEAHLRLGQYDEAQKDLATALERLPRDGAGAAPHEQAYVRAAALYRAATRLSDPKMLAPAIEKK